MILFTWSRSRWESRSAEEAETTTAQSGRGRRQGTRPHSQTCRGWNDYSKLFHVSTTYSMWSTSTWSMVVREAKFKLTFVKWIDEMNMNDKSELMFIVVVNISFYYSLLFFFIIWIPIFNLWVFLFPLVDIEHYCKLNRLSTI